MGEISVEIGIKLVTVQIDIPSSNIILTPLNLKDLLSKIREKLEQNSKIEMNDTLSFANKMEKTNSNNSKNIGSLLAGIAREDEEKIILEDIIVKNKENKLFLYLKSEPDWKFLKNKLKLEYGLTTSLDKAKKKAFTIVNNCDDIDMQIVDQYVNETIEIDSEEDQITRKDLLLTADFDVQKFTTLGVSIGNSKIKRTNVVTSSTSTVIEYRKVFLRFKLEPIPKFLEAVKDAIKSKDPRKLKDITNEFGQFIPKEVILGGRGYFKESSVARGNLEEISDGTTVNVDGRVGIENKVSKTSNKNNSSKYKSFKLFGGKQFSSRDFNEKDWAESLKDFRNWDCIKIQDPISIFQPLPEDLRKQILSLVGKKILYTSTEDFCYELSSLRKHETFNIPDDILKILQNKDADCNIFATVVDEKKVKNDTFSCQIFWPPNEDPKLIIHCIQKKFRERSCKLKIMLIIIGYDINFNFNRPDFKVQLKVLEDNFNASDCQTVTKDFDLNDSSVHCCFGIPVLRNLDPSNNSLVIGHHFFNDQNNRRIGSYIFSYCLNKRHFENLPDFTFYTLIISNYPNSGILPFKRSKRSKIKKMIRNTLSKHDSIKPKYISLYSTVNNFVPIFLKQKINETKTKYIDISNCSKDNCICNIRSQGFENNLRYAYFDPNQDKNLISYMRKFKMGEGATI